jgi:hypothetical protein
VGGPAIDAAEKNQVIVENNDTGLKGRGYGFHIDSRQFPVIPLFWRVFDPDNRSSEPLDITPSIRS